MWDNNNNWRPPSLSELTPYWISLGLTHLGMEASNCNHTDGCHLLYSDNYRWSIFFRHRPTTATPSVYDDAVIGNLNKEYVCLHWKIATGYFQLGSSCVFTNVDINTYILHIYTYIKTLISSLYRYTNTSTFFSNHVGSC